MPGPRAGHARRDCADRWPDTAAAPRTASQSAAGWPTPRPTASAALPSAARRAASAIDAARHGSSPARAHQLFARRPSADALVSTHPATDPAAPPAPSTALSPSRSLALLLTHPGAPSPRWTAIAPATVLRSSPAQPASGADKTRPPDQGREWPQGVPLAAVAATRPAPVGRTMIPSPCPTPRRGLPARGSGWRRQPMPDPFPAAYGGQTHAARARPAAPPPTARRNRGYLRP